MTPAHRVSLPFRITTYFTLLIAVLCLGYSEWDLVPESIGFTIAVVISLAVSFYLEGRYSLGLGKANLLGLGIGVIAVGWLAVKFTRGSNSALMHLSWPANLLPYMGPLVMILIPAKLFRPKHVGDWWTIQGIGLAAVVLASSMTDDPFFLVLVALYSLGAVWSLSLFFFSRSAGVIPALPGKVGLAAQLIGDARAHAEPSDGERGAWWHALLWLGLASIVALPLFFLSPRSSGERWGFTKSRLETGYNPEAQNDMGKVGDLESSAELAFEVIATNRDGTPKNDLDSSQLWRGASYSDYEKGNWIHKQYASGHLTRFRQTPPGEEFRPPDLGPNQYNLEFRASSKVAGPVIAAPTQWIDGQESPISAVRPAGRYGWSATYDGSFLAPTFPNRSSLGYFQATCPPPEPGLSPATELYSVFQTGMAEPELAVLTKMRLPRIRDWAIELLKKCVAAGKLPPGAIDSADTRAGFEVAPEYYEPIARVFTDYFQNSGEFEYSTKLRRNDRKIDPIEDFLWNTKYGPCARFASGLALALRALRIPAQYVIGFKGYEWGDADKLLVRQEHAHAWVEVLVPRPAPAGFAFKNPEGAKANRVWHWLSLDPTPGSAAVAANSGNWFDSARQKGVSFLNDYIIGYNPAKRVEAVESMTEAAETWWPYAALFAAFALLANWARRRYTHLRKMRVASKVQIIWYGRLLEALERHGQRPALGQTPKEFAEAAGDRLGATPAAIACAVPAFVISKLYRVRYAGAVLTPGEEAEVHAAIATLEAAPVS